MLKVLATIMSTMNIMPTTEDVVFLVAGRQECQQLAGVSSFELSQLIDKYGRKNMTTSYFKSRVILVYDMFSRDPVSACGYANDVYNKFFTDHI